MALKIEVSGEVVVVVVVVVPMIQLGVEIEEVQKTYFSTHEWPPCLWLSIRSIDDTVVFLQEISVTLAR